MNTTIIKALEKLFERHRIVFWYDTKTELRDDFDALHIDGIEKIRIENNEYGVKYRILRESPEKRYLIYRDGPKPEDLDNWLLDVELAHGIFRTGQAGIWLSELDLGYEFEHIVKEHGEFFQALKRRVRLKELLQADDTSDKIVLKMVAVCVACDARIDSIVEELLAEVADGRDEKIKLICRCKLDAFLWKQMSRCYGYTSETPGMMDFAVELFRSCYHMLVGGQIKLTSDALVFLKRWKDSRKYEKSFEKIATDCEEYLGIEQDVQKRHYQELLDLDYFRLIDMKIISDLVTGITNKTISSGDIALLVRQRKQSHWYSEFQHLYEALDYGAMLLCTIDEVKLEFNSLSDAIQRYSTTWFRIDQYYRKCIYHIRQAARVTLMEKLVDMVEQRYSNTFLLTLNDRFQQFVDTTDTWDAPPVPLQKHFFIRYVNPFLVKGSNKIVVIISDALRYEIGDELVSILRQEDGYDATNTPIMSMLPSDTQLGMAALLPNRELSFVDNDTGTVLVDGCSSQGTENRKKILEATARKPATAIKAEDFMALNRDDCRALTGENDVVYIYHNRIDATGHKRESEERVFEAAEEALADLIKIVKKANVSNILVTADHGFIYQNRELDESDFAVAEPEGEQILYRDRRFILGKGLKSASGLRTFNTGELSLTGSMEIQIPKSINRLRLKGAASRYVHGGASLQEIVIPVIQINKKRQKDVTIVDVDILRGANTIISSGQLAVLLYQVQPVTDKVKPRTIHAGIYSLSGEPISDTHTVTFDLVSENPRERELQVRFVLSRQADEVNGQEVILKLDEKPANISNYKPYKSLRYLLRRSFTSDFDL